MAHILVAGRPRRAGRASLDGAVGHAVRHIEEISGESRAPFIHEADALPVRTWPMGAAMVVKGADSGSFRVTVSAMTRSMSKRRVRAG